MKPLIFTIARLALLIVLGVAPVKTASAIEFEPRLLVGSVPPEWRAPLIQFLKELGASDVESMLSGTKAGHFPGDPAFLLFRVEAHGTCNDDQCLTIIAHLQGGGLVADAIFFAGNRLNIADIPTDFLGMRSYRVRFHSKEMIVTVVKTAKGWLMQAVKQPSPPL